MADYCEACDSLRNVAPAIELTGITDKMCQSLKEDTGLNPDLSVLHDNCTDIGALINCLMGSLIDSLPAFSSCDYKEFALELAKNTLHSMNAIACSDCGQWEQIWLIWKEIENIYKILDSLTGGATYRTMTPGVDYDTTFFNGWYTTSGNVRVRYIETNGYFEVIMDSPTSSDQIYRLYHDGLIAANVRMRHSSSVEEEPTSRIFGVNFKGNFSDLQDMTMRSQGGGGIWNLRPSAVRVAWDANCSIVNNNSGCKALVTWGSYADGYNQQLNISAYTSLPAWTGEVVCSGGANCTMTMLLIK